MPAFFKWRAFLEVTPWSGVERLRIFTKGHGDNEFDMVQPFTFKRYHGAIVPLEEYSLESQNSMLDGGGVRDFLQAMTNLAWEHGIKPAQIEDQRNELKAIREHIADMRTITTHLIQTRLIK
jgi:hypothetical protein